MVMSCRMALQSSEEFVYIADGFFGAFLISHMFGVSLRKL